MSEPRKTPSNSRSGTDYTMEFGKYRFRFSARDFRERCEFAAVQLAFVQKGALQETELPVTIAWVTEWVMVSVASGTSPRTGVVRSPATAVVEREKV